MYPFLVGADCVLLFSDESMVNPPSREPGAPIISEATDEDYYENVVIEEPNAGRLILYQVLQYFFNYLF